MAADPDIHYVDYKPGEPELLSVEEHNVDIKRTHDAAFAAGADWGRSQGLTFGIFGTLAAILILYLVYS